MEVAVESNSVRVPAETAFENELEEWRSDLDTSSLMAYTQGVRPLSGNLYCLFKSSPAREHL